MALKWTRNTEGALTTGADVKPKFRLRRLAQAVAIGSAMGATALVSTNAMALKTDFGLEYRATAFANASDAFETTYVDANGNQHQTDKSDTGFANLIRVKANFLDENTGISVYTSVQLAGDRWIGDQRPNTPTADYGYNVGSKGDNVILDLGYVQIPVGNTIFRIGRQASSFNNCFLVCDDRRDRILMLHPFSKSMTLIAGYDRRSDTLPYEHVDNGDMWDVGLVGKAAGWDYGILYVKWANNYSTHSSHPPYTSPNPPPATTPAAPWAYGLSNVDLWSGYLSGDLGPVNTAVGFNWVGDGNVKKGPGLVYSKGDSWAAYLRLTGNVGPVDLGVQYIGSWNGGLISGGYDTWSSMVNNNPDATQNPMSMYTMGGLGGNGPFGLNDADQRLVIGKVGFHVTPKFSITGAIGNLYIDNGKHHAAFAPGRDEDDRSMVYDLRFAYQVNDKTKTWLSLGYLEKNKAATLSGNAMTSLPSSAMDEGVRAASLNLTVDI